MNKFRITFDVLYRNCEVEIEAETKHEASDKLHDMGNEEFDKVIQDAGDCDIKNEVIKELK